MTFTNEEWADIYDRKAAFCERGGRPDSARAFAEKAAEFRAKAEEDRALAAEKCGSCDGCDGWGGGNGDAAEAHCPECGY